MSETRLAKVRTHELAALLTNIAIDDARQVEAMRRAEEFPPTEAGVKQAAAMLELTDEALKGLGWTRRELHVAMGANLNSKDAPIYLKVVGDRFALRFRDGAGEKPSRAARVVMPIQINNYAEVDRSRVPVLDLGGDK